MKETCTLGRDINIYVFVYLHISFIPDTSDPKEDNTVSQINKATITFPFPTHP